MSTSIRPERDFPEATRSTFPAGDRKMRREEDYSDHAKGFLLFDVSFVKQADVNNDLAWLATWLGLKSNPEPAVRFVALFETARRNCVGENEKCFLGAELFVKPFDESLYSWSSIVWRRTRLT